MGLTNRGKKLVWETAFRQTWDGGVIPSNFYMFLATNDVVPDSDTKLIGELTEIVAGNGYTSGGILLNPDAVDFVSLIEDDALDQSRIKIRDLDLVASGGTIPPSGSGSSYYVLTDDLAPPSNRNVIAFWPTSSPIFVSDGQTHKIQGLTIVMKDA